MSQRSLWQFRRCNPWISIYLTDTCGLTGRSSRAGLGGHLHAMIDRTARESCDTSYHEARSVASDEAEQDQHSEPSAAHDGSVASETPYNAEWLSELIGTASVLLKSSSFLLGHLGVNPRKVHAGHLWSLVCMQVTYGTRSFAKLSKRLPGICYQIYCKSHHHHGCVPSS